MSESNVIGHRREDFINDLRELARIYEENPGLPIPDYKTHLNVYQPKKEHIKVALKAFGKLEKRFGQGSIEHLLFVNADFGFFFDFSMVFDRKDLCRVITPAVIECDPLLEVASGSTDSSAN